MEKVERDQRQRRAGPPEMASLVVGRRVFCEDAGPTLRFYRDKNISSSSMSPAVWTMIRFA